METNTGLYRLTDYSNHFKILQILLYKDLIINSTNVRILGIHLMNYGLDWRVHQHRHSFFEFHYVTENDVYTTIHSTEYRIAANHFYLIPPGAYHSHRQAPGSSHIGFALRWEFITETDSPRPLQHQTVSNELTAIVSTLLQASSQPICDNHRVIQNTLITILEDTPGNHPLITFQLRLCQLILQIADFYRSPLANRPSEANLPFLENQIVKNAVRFIDENFAMEIQSEDISHAVHVSYSQLARLFKRYTGETLTCHLNRIRLGQAQLLLKCSTKSIGQIAREVGYNSEYYFCSLFKKFYGISPRHYRVSWDRLNE
ncbi:MAG TPA: hypothetical protein DDW65_14975 [Firmicutes bacterium]|jgi:AraC-like DNA-binding protein|nr:hypothetical protein [Bacillota bacterium]